MPYQWKGLRNYESRSSPYLTNNKKEDMLLIGIPGL